MPFKDLERRRSYHREWKNNHPEQVRVYNQKYYVRHREAVRLRSKRYNQAHRTERSIHGMIYEKEHQAQRAASRKRYDERYPGRRGALNRKSAWKARGIDMDVERYNVLLTNQQGVCAICGHLPDGRRLHVDHDHVTSRVRGLLCGSCNRIVVKVAELHWDRLKSYLGVT